MDLLSAGVLLLSALCGLSVGAPAVPSEHPVSEDYVCGKLEPPNGEIQNMSAPYTISVSQNNVKPGGSVKVTVSSNTPAYPIGGLVLKAKCGGKVLGSFSSDLVDILFQDCDGIKNSGLLYIDDENPNIVEAAFTWTAPSGVPCQDVRFHATIVKDMTTYWIDEISPRPLSIIA